MRYFPRYKGYVSMPTQVDKIAEETIEVMEAFMDTSLKKKKYIIRVVEETLDVIHACETLLYFIRDNFCIDIDREVKRVKKKNKKRHYYEG